MAIREVDKSSDHYRTFTLAGMLLVSATACVMSFIHIETVAIHYGQPLIAALLLPFSIDGAIVVSSMAMLRAARLQMTTPLLARGMLLLSIAATLSCNVAFGLAHGVPGALLSAWPAIAFTGSAEIAVSMTRRKPARVAAIPSVSRVEVESTPKTDLIFDTQSATTGDAESRVGRQIDQESAALTAIAANPRIGFPELAVKLGVSESTARRIRARVESKLTSSESAVTADESMVKAW